MDFIIKDLTRFKRSNPILHTIVSLQVGHLAAEKGQLYYSFPQLQGLWEQTKGKTRGIPLGFSSLR